MHALRTLTLCVASLSLAGGALAQTAAPAKPAKAGKQVIGNKISARAIAAPVVVMPPPEADGEQLVAAALTLFGHYDCEYDQKLMVSKHPTAEGYVDVAFGKQTYTMKPVRSMTGALRLEEVSGSMLMVQIPSKSMLMDTKVGRRILDACKSHEQRQEVETANSLGINATGQIQLPDPTTASAQVQR